MRFAYRWMLFVCLPLAAQDPAGCDLSAGARKAQDAFEEAGKKDAALRGSTAKLQFRAKLAGQFPADAMAQEQYLQTLSYWDPDQLARVRERAVKAAESRPDDVLAQHLAALTLFRTDTPKAISFAEKAMKLSPGYPPSAFLLGEVYSSGRFVDKQKAAEYHRVYFKACGLGGRSTYSLGKTGSNELLAEVAAELRKRFEVSEPHDLRDWETLWGLEFRGRPVAEHPAVRKQVAADLARIEASKSDRRWEVLLRGLKQSGAEPEKIRAMEDRLLKEQPTSQAAYAVFYERWKNDNKAPEDPKDTAAWKTYNAKRGQMLDEAKRRFTEVEYLDEILKEHRLDTQDLPKEEQARLIEELFAEQLKDSPPRFWMYSVTAYRYLDQQIYPERALARLKEAMPLLEKDVYPDPKDDTLTDSERQESAKQLRRSRQYFTSDVFRAAMRANQPQAVEAVRSWVSDQAPTDKNDVANWWLLRARLARIDGKPADALAFYQQSLFTRMEPKPWQGKLRDDVGDEVREFFLKQGGTETAFEIWRKPAGGSPQPTEGRWEKAEKTIPAFTLTDLKGATWKLSQLEGKSVLINVWATWCGPCREELPKLQQLYTKVKDRSDIQVITFNIDDDLGLVEPFVKEKGYTFPVLPAYRLVNEILGMVSIPQNWLLDAKGKWQWTQRGYDAADTAWVDTMIGKLEALKK